MVCFLHVCDKEHSICQFLSYRYNYYFDTFYERKTICLVFWINKIFFVKNNFEKEFMIKNFSYQIYFNFLMLLSCLFEVVYIHI